MSPYRDWRDRPTSESNSDALREEEEEEEVVVVGETRIYC